jgi:hypothetical protein
VAEIAATWLTPTFPGNQPKVPVLDPLGVEHVGAVGRHHDLHPAAGELQHVENDT